MPVCKDCGLGDGVRLLDDFFPVGEHYAGGDGIVTRVTIDEHHQCQYCRKYGDHWDPDAIAAEVATFMTARAPVLVAFSGGKDSLTALQLTAKLGLPAIAFTFDNGFIPEPVLAQARRMCTALGVPYEVHRAPMYEAFLSEYGPDSQGRWVARTGNDFCRQCSQHIGGLARRLAVAHGSDWVVYGNKNYASLTPRVTACRVIDYLANESQQKRLISINLLFALQITTAVQRDILAAAGWQDPGLPGYTSNCLVPGFVEYPRFQKNNAHADAGYIELERRSGHYSAEEWQEMTEDRHLVDRSPEMTDFFRNLGLPSATHRPPGPPEGGT
jgi:hypothetical protein